jgi:hypothetical protein
MAHKLKEQRQTAAHDTDARMCALSDHLQRHDGRERRRQLQQRLTAKLWQHGIH